MPYIYELCDPDTEQPRYVGRAKNPKERYYNHIAEAKAYLGSDRKNEWINDCLQRGRQPLLKIVKETTEAQQKQDESDHIGTLLAQGHDLLNDINKLPRGFPHKVRKDYKVIHLEVTNWLNEALQDLAQEQGVPIEELIIALLTHAIGTPLSPVNHLRKVSEIREQERQQRLQPPSTK